MLKLVYLWDSDYPWDVRAEKVCTALQKAGHQVHLIARNKGWRSTYERREECQVYRMRPWRPLGRKLDNALGFPAFFNPRWLNLVLRTAVSVKANAIIVRDLPLTPTALYVGKQLGIPVVGDLAENYPAMMRAIWEAGREKPMDYIVRNPFIVSLVERHCLRRMDRVVAVVEEAAERFSRLGVPRDKIDIVSNTPPIRNAVVCCRADDVKYRRVVARSKGSVPKRNTRHTLKMVYLGLLEIPRGIIDVLKAVALLANRSRTHNLARTHVNLIGDGRDREVFESYAAQLGLRRDEIEFTGYLPHNTALQIVADSDVGLVPHVRCEAWDTTIPNKLFDYMAAGKPVISSDTVPCARILSETKAGEIYPSGNSEALANSITRMMDPELRTTRGEAGRRAVLERYHWERDSATLLRSIKSAVDLYTRA